MHFIAIVGWLTCCVAGVAISTLSGTIWSHFQFSTKKEKSNTVNPSNFSSSHIYSQFCNHFLKISNSHVNRSIYYLWYSISIFKKWIWRFPNLRKISGFKNRKLRGFITIVPTSLCSWNYNMQLGKNWVLWCVEFRTFLHLFIIIKL